MIGQGGMVAFAVLLLWTPIVLLCFATMRPALAAAVGIFGATLLLPLRAAFDLPFGLVLGKSLIGTLATVLGALLFARGRLRSARPLRGVDLFFVVAMVSAALTVATNRDPIAVGRVALPGLSPYELVADWLYLLLRFWLPFFIGRAMLRSSRDLHLLFVLLVSAGLVYSLLVLVELRMSPQFHRWIYGYHQHTFSQVIRASGYRPMVFMSHGLTLSFFYFACAMAALALLRSRALRLGPLATSGYLGLILVACKSLGALLYGLLSAPLVAFTRPRFQATAAAALAALAMAYPAARIAGVAPVYQVVELARTFDTDRGNSLGARISAEDTVITRVMQRPLFGWGGHGRADARDAAGTSRVVWDGMWIIFLGSRGLVGFYALWALLCAPIAMLWLRLPQIRRRRTRVELATLGVVLAFALIDSIPNSVAGSPWVLFLCGALAGCVKGCLAEERRLLAHAETEDESLEPASLLPGGVAARGATRRHGPQPGPSGAPGSPRGLALGESGR